jgi:hypothetical protein
LNLSVIDASALLALQDVAVDPQQAFDWMKAQVKAGSLVFPKAVCEDVKRLGEATSGAAIWVMDVRRDQVVPDAAEHCWQAVILSVPNLVAEDGDREPCAVQVAAMALELQQNGHRVTVVTEDVNERKPETPLASGCTHLGIVSQRLKPWLEGNGHACH